jgi:ABC-type transporter Mla subunit MlaD
MIDVRERTSEGLNRSRVELELRRSRRPLITVLVGAAIGLAITLYIAVHVDPTFLTSTYTARFAVDDATGVHPGSQEIRLKGIPAGVISGVQMVNGQPVITARWKTSYGRIYRNAQVQLRPNTPLMDMYLDVVNRGTPSAGVLSGSEPLPAAQTHTAVNVDDVLDVFKSDARERLAALLDNLGNGLRDRGAQLRAAVVALSPLLEVAGRVSNQVAERQAITSRLVHNTSVLMTALANRSADLRSLVSQGSAALSALQSGAPNLAATLQELPPALAQLTGTFAAVRGVLGDANGAIRSLYPVAGDVPAALTALRDLNTTGAPAVRALQQPVLQLVPFSEALPPVSSDLQSTVRGVLPQVPVLDRGTTDLVTCKPGLEAFFQDTASLGKYGDERGIAPRGNLVVGGQSFAVANPYEFRPQPCVPGAPLGSALPTSTDEH